MSGASRAALMRQAARRLRDAGVEDAAGDARALLRAASGLDAAAFSARTDAPADAAEAALFADWVTRRAAREPVARILGRRMFWGRDFRVTPDVLDPRPETEILIAAALEGPAPATMLDLGTGSGCILLTLLAEFGAARGLGVDISEGALACAAENARALGLDARAAFRRGDWLDGVEGPFDLVVSNPPYIPEAEMAGLAPEVADEDPRAALTPGGDGLAPYRAIAADLDRVLAPGGRALFEIGADAEAAVEAIFTEAGYRTGRREDFDLRVRCIFVQRPKGLV